jgi:hypothetical protein
MKGKGGSGDLGLRAEDNRNARRRHLKIQAKATQKMDLVITLPPPQTPGASL